MLKILSDPWDRDDITKTPNPMQASHTIMVKKAKTKLDISLDLKVKQIPENKVDNDKTSNLSNTVTKWGVILILSTIKTRAIQIEPVIAINKAPNKKK